MAHVTSTKLYDFRIVSGGWWWWRNHEWWWWWLLKSNVSIKKSCVRVACRLWLLPFISSLPHMPLHIVYLKHSNTTKLYKNFICWIPRALVNCLFDIVFMKKLRIVLLHLFDLTISTSKFILTFCVQIS